MKNHITAKLFLLFAIIAIFTAIIMTLLSTVPPLSWIYNWAKHNNVKFVWNGIIAGVIALCELLIYHFIQ